MLSFDRRRTVSASLTSTTNFLHPRPPISCKNDDGLNLKLQMMTYDDMYRAIFYTLTKPYFVLYMYTNVIRI
jgi:hypothetical protein